MAEQIENPRQSPRAPVRCDARIALRQGGFWISPTRDYGPRGCQVLAPSALEPGARLFVELLNERVDGPVELAGRVAWTAREEPWRTGIAFDAGSLPAARTFFDLLVAAYPGVDTYGRAPDRVSADAPLAPVAPPPELEPRLSPDEAEVLRAIGAGATAGELRERLAARWADGTTHALFSLLGRRYLAHGGPDERAAAAWKALLGARE